MAALNQSVADLFVSVVAFFSRLPFAEFHPPSPGVFWLLCYGVFIVVLAGIIRSKLLYRLKPLEYSSRTSRASSAVMLFAGMFMMVLSARMIFPGKGFEIAFPDVGQGDSALIRLSAGENILIDGGGTYDGRFDIGRRVLAPWLWDRGVRKLDFIILSHPHPDHMNGLKYILRKFDVSEVWTHGYDDDLSGYDDFNRIIAERGIRRKKVSSEDAPVMLGGAELSVLHPPRAFRNQERQAYAAENDRSLVVRIADGGFAALFTGDIGTDIEKDLIRSGRDLTCDLLKVPHHGSKSSSSEPFVAASRPSVAIVTVGRGNPYHHPSVDVLARYEDIGARTFRTDRDGAIVVARRDGTHETVIWNELALRRIDRSDTVSSWEQERKNLKRVYFRRWEL